MVKTTSGEEIPLKEAWKRFKQGVKDITPLQKTKTEIWGTAITLCGFICGLIVSIFKAKDIGLLSYALIMIFTGSAITTITRLLGLIKQYKTLKHYTMSFNLDDVIEIADGKEGYGMSDGSITREDYFNG